MIQKVISGGQTGADQAGWRAAKRFGLETGGWMPPEFKNEVGRHLQFKQDYNAREIERTPDMIYPAGGTDWSEAYRVRTRLNVRDADFTIWFGDPRSPGGKLTTGACLDLGRPYSVVGTARYPVFHVVDVLRRNGPRVINVSGNRESKAYGIGRWVEEYLCEVFRKLGLKEIGK